MTNSIYVFFKYGNVIQVSYTLENTGFGTILIFVFMPYKKPVFL